MLLYLMLYRENQAFQSKQIAATRSLEVWRKALWLVNVNSAKTTSKYRHHRSYSRDVARTVSGQVRFIVRSKSNDVASIQ